MLSNKEALAAEGWTLIEDDCAMPPDGTPCMIMVEVCGLPFLIPAKWRVDDKDKSITVCGISIPGVKALAWRAIGEATP